METNSNLNDEDEQVELYGTSYENYLKEFQAS